MSISITATELKLSLGEYLELAKDEDIYITKNKKVIAKLTNPYENKTDTAKWLFGALSEDSVNPSDDESK